MSSRARERPRPGSTRDLLIVAHHKLGWERDAARMSIYASQLGDLCREGCPHVLGRRQAAEARADAVLAWQRER